MPMGSTRSPPSPPTHMVHLAQVPGLGRSVFSPQSTMPYHPLAPSLLLNLSLTLTLTLTLFTLLTLLS